MRKRKPLTPADDYKRTQRKQMRLFTLFSGIGAPEQGAIRVYGKGNVELVGACEWDKFARQSFMAIYGIDEERFYKDVNDLGAAKYKGKVDILVGGSPCQSFSIAGLRKGTTEERGQLIYQYIRVVNECRPPIIIYENVKGIMSIDNGNTIKEFVQALRDIGYHCHYDVINSKDYGVPQNRERLFLVGFLDAELYHKFNFADKVPLTKRLKDILEDEVDEKYYLSDKLINGFAAKKEKEILEGRETGFCFNPLSEDEVSTTITARYFKSGISDPYIKVPSATQCNQAVMLGLLDIKGTDQIRRVYGTDGVAPTLTTMQGGNQEPKICNPVIAASRGRNKANPSDRTPGNKVEQRLEINSSGTSNTITSVQKDNYVIETTLSKKVEGWYEKEGKEVQVGDAIQTGQANMKGQRIYKDGVCPTLPAENPRVCGVLPNYRIRKLTTLECWRLQDFPDEAHNKARDAGVSNSQLYKQAGNSMPVNVLEMIFNQIEKAKRGETAGLF